MNSDVAEMGADEVDEEAREYIMTDAHRSVMTNMDICPPDTALNVSGDNDTEEITLCLGPSDWKNPEYADGDLSQCSKVGGGSMRHVALANLNYGGKGEINERGKLHAIFKCRLFESAGIWTVQAATDALYDFVKRQTTEPCKTPRKTWTDVETCKSQSLANAFLIDTYGALIRQRNRSQLHAQSHENKIIAVRHNEGNSNGLMFCGRTNIVRNIKLVYYERHYDGPYNDRLQSTEEKPNHAFTRFVVAFISRGTICIRCRGEVRTC